MSDRGSEPAHDRSEVAARRSAEVLPFRVRDRPRGRSGLGPTDPAAEWNIRGQEPPEDPAGEEQKRAAEDNVDYRQRMLMNVIAAVVLTLLIAGSVWIADAIATTGQIQDCLMQGRWNCAPIAAAAPKR